MKKIYLVLLGICLLIQVNAQDKAARQLTWTLGEVEMTRGQLVQVRYPVMVAISDDHDEPQLGTSTIRLFYDAGQLKDLTIQSIANSYQVKGLHQSNDVFGEIFNFVGGGGIFAQFNILANMDQLLPISTEPVHVFDLSFTVQPGAKIPLCAPLVLDNQTKTEKSGSAADTGYLPNEGGISGTYHLHGNAGKIYLADDEVEHYLWKKDVVFDKVIDRLEDRTGAPVRLKARTCLQLETTPIAADVDGFDVTTVDRGGVRIQWKTLSEFNNDHFEIQHSTDGHFFETIGKLDGQWNTVEPRDYAFVDDRPLSGRNYYRLLQTDNNGYTAYSKTVAIALETAPMPETSDWQVSYFPNPTRGKVQLRSSLEFTNFLIEVFDNKGQLVLEKNIDSDETLDLSSLSAGIYHLSLLNREGIILNTEQITVIAH